jgi:hypothetical protein
MTALIVIYILGVFGFGGVLFAIGRDDYSWPVLALMALGWPPLCPFFILLLILAVLEAAD